MAKKKQPILVHMEFPLLVAKNMFIPWENLNFKLDHFTQMQLSTKELAINDLISSWCNMCHMLLLGSCEYIRMEWPVGGYTMYIL